MERTQHSVVAYRSTVSKVLDEIDAAFAAGDVLLARSFDDKLSKLAEQYRRVVSLAVRLDARDRTRSEGPRDRGQHTVIVNIPCEDGVEHATAVVFASKDPGAALLTAKPIDHYRNSADAFGVLDALTDGDEPECVKFCNTVLRVGRKTWEDADSLSEIRMAKHNVVNLRDRIMQAADDVRTRRAKMKESVDARCKSKGDGKMLPHVLDMVARVRPATVTGFLTRQAIRKQITPDMEADYSGKDRVDKPTAEERSTCCAKVTSKGRAAYELHVARDRHIKTWAKEHRYDGLARYFDNGGRRELLTLKRNGEFLPTLKIVWDKIKEVAGG